MASIFLISLLSSVLCDPKVLALTDETFENTIKKNSIVLVKFYAPWCGHCKTFAPEYERLAHEVNKKSLPYIIANMDATVHPKTTESQGVGSYPTIKLYYEGTAMDYGGARSVEAILDFIAKATGPFSTELKTSEDIKKLTNAGKLISILATVDNETLKVYAKVGKKVYEYEYYNAEVGLMTEIFAGIKEGNVVVLKSFDEYQVVYTESFNEDSLLQFLNFQKNPVVVPINQEVIKNVFNTGKQTGVLLMHSGLQPELPITEDEFRKAALTLRSPDFAFAKTDIQESWGQRAANFLGIEECPKPILIIVMKKGEFYTYRYEGELTADNIKKFIEQYKEGKVKRYLKSEEEPKENPGPVFKVVGKSFKKEVLDNDNDVLVKFHAPWCGQCKKLVPIFKSLAGDMKENKKLKFLEIDATKNDVEGHVIKFYPTLKFFPGKDKSDVKVYNGDRTEDDLKKFIIEMTSYPELFNEKKSDL